MRRAAFISPMQSLILAVRAEKFPSIGPQVYASLIQSGIDRLEFLNEPFNGEPLLLPRNRFSVVKNRAYGQSVAAALAVTGGAIAVDDPKCRAVSSWTWAFMTDLLYAIRTRKPLITFGKIPDTQEVRDCLSPAIGPLVEAVLRQIQPTSLEVATPSHHVPVRGVAVFEEIISDPAFARYMAIHGELADASLPRREARKQIGRQSKRLIQRHKMLKLETLAARTLNVSARFIDKVLGLIPGLAGQQFVEGAAGLLDDRQRIVIYDCSKSHLDFIRRELELEAGRKLRPFDR